MSGSVGQPIQARQCRVNLLCLATDGSYSDGLKSDVGVSGCLAAEIMRLDPLFGCFIHISHVYGRGLRDINFGPLGSVICDDQSNCVIEEFVNDAFDSALDLDDMEDEIDEVVDKVLTAIFGDTATQIPEADEGLDDDEDLEEIRARLAKVTMAAMEQMPLMKCVVHETTSQINGITNGRRKCRRRRIGRKSKNDVANNRFQDPLSIKYKGWFDVCSDDAVVSPMAGDEISQILNSKVP
ncbi:hypothetical protein Tco_1505061 [Tanacetum coccineum]